MGRLIDADALIETLKKYKFGAISNDVERECIKEVILTFVENEPTAYNIDKVVAEIRRSSGSGYRDVDRDYVPPMIKTDKAIDIVKRGGMIW